MPSEDEKEDVETDEERERGVRQRLEGFIPDLVKRTFYAGLGAVFTTEEGIRKLASDFHLPKDVANYLINSAQSTKEELFRIVAREIHDFFQNVNLNQELQKLLTSLSFEIKTEIRFIPNDEAVSGVKADVKRKVSIKRNRDDKAESADEPLPDTNGTEK